MRKPGQWTASLILIAALIGSALPASAQDAAGSITITPAETGNTAVKHSQMVKIAGTVPEGEVTQVRVLAYYEDGTTAVQPINANSYNRGPVSSDPEANYFLNDGGNLSGQLTLACLFMAPDQACSDKQMHVRSASVEVSITGVPFESNKLRVDYLRPYIRGYELVARDTVLVKFSEPVRHGETDSIADWQVTDPTRVVLNVTNAPNSDCTYLPGEDPSAGVTGCARALLLPQVGEDDQPLTTYAFGTIPVRELYEDFASNTIRVTNPERSSRALDKVAPRVPAIDSVDGKTTTVAALTGGTKRVASTNDTPEIVVKSVTAGHVVSLFQETNGTAGLQGDDSLVDAKPATGERATFSPTFAGDGDHVIYATATDTHDNPSPSADTVLYRLDTVAPAVQAAKAVGSRVTVTFTEALTSGRDAPTDWSLEADGEPIPVLLVTGEGDYRTLETQNPIPSGATVSYSNTDELRYKDEAGNGLAPFTSFVIAGLIPKIIDTEPEQEERPVAKFHTLTSTVTDQTGVEVAGAMVGFRVIDGPTASTNYDGDDSTPPGVIGHCLSQSDGACSLPYTSFELGTDTIQSWIDRDGDLSTVDYPEAEDRDGVSLEEQDVVEVTWTAKGADLVLDATPEAASQRLVFNRRVDVSVTTPPPVVDFPPVTGDPSKITGVNVDVRVVTSDGERYLGECFTSSSGACSVTFGGAKTGVDSIQTWIDRDFDDSVGEDDELLGDGLYVENKGADGFVAIDDPAQDVVEIAWSLGLKRLSLKAPRRTTTGKTVKITGVVSGDSACRATSVAIVRRIAGKRAKTIRTVKSFSRGWWSYKFRPRFNATYEARSAQTARCQSADSATKRIGVRAKVTRNVADNTLRPRQRAVITGKVSPWKKGRTVQLLMKQGRKWKVVRRDRLNRRSKYAFRGYFANVGTRSFKVRYVGDRRNDPGTSWVFRLRVSRYRF